MKTNYQKVLCVAVLLGSAVTVSAQEKKKDLNREMTLEREYDPTVQDANKVNTLPEIKEPEVTKRTIDYSPFTLPTDPEKQITVLPSGNIMTQLDANKRRGYLHLGAGMHLNIDGDFGYHILSTEKDKLNLFFSHRSTNGKANYVDDYYYYQIDKDTKAKLNDNWGGLNYAHVFEKAILNLGAQYRYTGFNYWGVPSGYSPNDPDEYISQSDRETNQVNQTIQVKAGIEAHEDADVFYLVDLDYINFSHKYGLNEQLDGPTEHTIDAKFDLNARFNGEQRLGVSGQVEYFNYNLPVYPAGTGACLFQNHAEIIVSPYYKVKGDNWNVKLGANIMFVTGEDDSFTASPNVEADVEVADRTVLYLTAKGRLYSNSAYETSLVNRYANPTEEIAPTREWLNGQLGIKSGVAKSFWFDVFAGYRIASDDCLFLPARSFNGFAGFLDAERFVNTKRFFAGANLKYSYQDFLEISVKGVYNHWTAEFNDETDWTPSKPDIEHAWGKPKVELDADLTVKPINKLAISLNYHLATDRYTELNGAQVVKLDNINELNLTGSYTFNDTFGLFVKATNLLNQNYELYYGYPAQGISVMGGVNINF
ncbi:TonB-dependent receptor [Parabacteroides sp. An277]|uniref:TonB-dependent receptor n=1 Tax=Parabacteroides sp. An277 TaxID=1965619 RepID=UPI000B3923A2|nr:TonB-dependent receptor [Parabacteroides sp. An277]OUO54996.1 TonB-dependent receptor [Parabacteroides sp. An277]